VVIDDSTEDSVILTGSPLTVLRKRRLHSFIHFSAQIRVPCDSSRYINLVVVVVVVVDVLNGYEHISKFVLLRPLDGSRNEHFI